MYQVNLDKCAQCHISQHHKNTVACPSHTFHTWRGGHKAGTPYMRPVSCIQHTSTAAACLRYLSVAEHERPFSVCGQYVWPYVGMQGSHLYWGRENTFKHAWITHLNYLFLNNYFTIIFKQVNKNHYSFNRYPH